MLLVSSLHHQLILTRSPTFYSSSVAVSPMAMSLQIPSSPSDGSSSSSSTHPPSPLTPPSITDSLPNVNADLSSTMTPPTAAGKRKPSRRANTAERRATHNAVERQRRETLNGRFLVSRYCRFLVYLSVLISSFRISLVFCQICLKFVAPQSLPSSTLRLPTSTLLAVTG